MKSDDQLRLELKTPAYKGKTARRVKCRSGIFGERHRLRLSYENMSEFLWYAGKYGLAKKLGYSTARGAWRANPVIEVSVNSSDYRKVCA